MHLNSSVSETARSRAFLVKLLIQGAFDAFIESPAFLWIAPESTEFVEALWTRREPFPALARESPLLPVVAQ